MFRLLTTLPAIALLLAALPASAAPRPDEKPGGPAVVGQAKSFNELLEMAKTLVKNVGGDAIYKEFEKEVLPDLDPKKLPGIDPKRRFGIYGYINAKLEDCRGVLMIPVPSENDFVNMLAAHRIDIVKGKEPGVSDIVTPPDFPIPVSFRVYKEYAYVSIGGSDVLADKALLDPRDVISDKEKAAAYLSIRLDRITPEAKKAMAAIIRDQLENLKEMIPEPELKDAFHSAEKLANRWLKILFEEAKEITLRVDADTKTGDLFGDITVEPMPKSPLAEAIASRKPNINAFASLAGDDYVQRVFITAPLFAEEAKEGWSKLIDWGTKEIIKEAGRGNTPPEVLALVDAASKSLKATVESGEMDLAAALRGPNKDGFYNVVGAVHCREGAQLEKAIREVVKVLPERERSYFKFDAGKIGDLSVHEIDMSTEAGELIQKLFGKGQKAYFAFGKNALYASYGPDGMKMLKEAIEAKPGPAAAFDNLSNGKKTVELVKKILPDNDPNGPGINLGWVESMTGAMRLSVEGGDKLKIRASLNVGMMMYFMLGRSFEAGAKPVPPPVAK
jgi:hypothetical protein